MELRVLRYFVTVAREQSVTGAADVLHVSQPALSRQLMDMEDELGKKLFIRGSRKITLTENGMILRKHAEEILSLVEKTKEEIAVSDSVVAGDVYVGSGELDEVRYIVRAAKEVRTECPHVCMHISSGDEADLRDDLDKGLIDFAVIIGDINHEKYESLAIPVHTKWGVLMKNDDKLATKKKVRTADFFQKPLIFSRSMLVEDLITEMFHKKIEELDIAATYSLLYNGSLMVEEGLGYAVCLDKIINTSGDSQLCFRPFTEQLILPMNIIWKKYQILSKASMKFIEQLKQTVQQSSC